MFIPFYLFSGCTSHSSNTSTFSNTSFVDKDTVRQPGKAFPERTLRMLSDEEREEFIEIDRREGRHYPRSAYYADDPNGPVRLPGQPTRPGWQVRGEANPDDDHISPEALAAIEADDAAERIPLSQKALSEMENRRLSKTTTDYDRQEQLRWKQWEAQGKLKQAK